VCGVCVCVCGCGVCVVCVCVCGVCVCGVCVCGVCVMCVCVFCVCVCGVCVCVSLCVITCNNNTLHLQYVDSGLTEKDKITVWLKIEVGCCVVLWGVVGWCGELCGVVGCCGVMWGISERFSYLKVSAIAHWKDDAHLMNVFMKKILQLQSEWSLCQTLTKFNSLCADFEINLKPLL